MVCFSGDKLLGGPQAGILLGRAETIAALKRHPLARAIRVDKMTLAALEGTLQLYRDPEAARKAIPTLRYLERTPAETEALAGDVFERLRRRCEDAGVAAELAVEPTLAKAGGGSLPLLEIPSHAVTVRPGAGERRGPGSSSSGRVAAGGGPGGPGRAVSGRVGPGRVRGAGAGGVGGLGVVARWERPR